MPKGVFIRTKPIWNKGLTKKDPRIAKLEEKRIQTVIEKEIFKGPKNPGWRGGGSESKYENFGRTIHEKIRHRDNYKCTFCGKTQIDQILEMFLQNKQVYRLSIHHIDEDKRNSTEDNLTTLCHSCHQKSRRK